MILSTAAIIEKASTASFGKPLIENTWRAIVVEAIVSSALPPIGDGVRRIGRGGISSTVMVLV